MKVGYARVSTDEQNNELQMEALRAQGCEKIFFEAASGVSAERPQLKAALSFLREGDVLVVWKLDRLARSMRQLVTSMEYLKQNRIGFVSLTEAIDSASPAGMLLFHVMGALAEFERSLIAERTRAGIAAAKANGKRCGRPRVLNDADVLAAKALLSEPGISVPDVATRLGVSVPTLYRYLPAAKSATRREWSIGPCGARRF